MKCATMASLSILWNGKKLESFKLTRGIRQGDPLSPYRFVLYMEALCHSITSAVAAGER